MIVNKKTKIISYIILIVFIIITLFISFYHENWRDEVQAYLLCRDMNFFELLKNIHYEGHPFVYYLILYPFVKMGVGMKIVNILSLIFIYISAWLILFKTDLKIYNKFFILFSYPFIYEYSIIGRSYSLIILLIVLIGVLYKDRRNNAITIGVLSGLLLNTHLLVSGFVLSIFIFFYLYELLFNRKKNSLVENRKILIGFLILCFSGVLLVLQFLPILFNGIAMSINRFFSISTVIRNLYLILNCFSFKNFVAIFMILILLIGYFIMLFKESKMVFFSLIFNLFYYSVFCSYVWGDVSGHVVYLLLIYFFFYSITKQIRYNYILLVIFLFTLNTSLNSIVLDYKNDFSTAQNIYRYMAENVGKDDLIITVDDAITETILGYDDNYRFYDLKSNRYYTYIIWDQKRENKKIDYSYLDKEMSKGRKTYFILAYENNICGFNSFVLKQIRDRYKTIEVFNNASKVTALGEKYVLYELLNK